jgi:hypothetical protein
MPHSPQLAALADEVDRLLARPGFLAVARKLATECLDNPEQSQVDALQLPADPNDPADWTEDSLLVRAELATVSQRSASSIWLQSAGVQT